ncbi:hypothetical protein PIB30_075484 [Stylosanthes scabra]|uniref:Uncharacterized protein n=1 Tax=Stylosanthes scabra TaxID=79078 RepID=A0ABU6UPC4_9FABA|nr:hypothetical protein [Stylosanthes scabra]
MLDQHAHCTCKWPPRKVYPPPHFSRRLAAMRARQARDEAANENAAPHNNEVVDVSSDSDSEQVFEYIPGEEEGIEEEHENIPEYVPGAEPMGEEEDHEEDPEEEPEEDPEEEPEEEPQEEQPEAMEHDEDQEDINHGEDQEDEE